MNPDGLMSAFKREVIDKTPQKFKIKCLLELSFTFPRTPFFAGFGNRTTVRYICFNKYLFIGCC
jgi:phosphatidate phosphatase LPIN